MDTGSRGIGPFLQSVPRNLTGSSISKEVEDMSSYKACSSHEEDERFAEGSHGDSRR
jgi:hypothetical protein